MFLAIRHGWSREVNRAAELALIVRGLAVWPTND
jgi:hypothetical protein